LRLLTEVAINIKFLLFFLAAKNGQASRLSYAFLLLGHWALRREWGIAENLPHAPCAMPHAPCPS
jgi:hypothetical protein